MLFLRLGHLLGSARRDHLTWLCLLLLGCPAEMLGIPVPDQGVAALSMEDVKRDRHGLGGPDRDVFLLERLQQMGLRVEGACGIRPGSGPEVVAVLAEAEPSAGAVLISVAKALHGRPTDPRGAAFCFGEERSGDRVVRIGPVVGGEVDWDRAATHVRVSAAGGQEDHRVALGVAKGLVPLVQRWLSEPREASRTDAPVDGPGR